MKHVVLSSEGAIVREFRSERAALDWISELRTGATVENEDGVFGSGYTDEAEAQEWIDGLVVTTCPALEVEEVSND